MHSSTQQVLERFGGYVRVRVCGIAVDSDDRVLVIRHHALLHDGPFWAPPGGSVEWQEPLPDALRREFSEETGLIVRIGDLLAVNEFIHPPLHTLEHFFRVYPESGTAMLGSDPEFAEPIMEELAWMPWADLQALPESHVHPFLRSAASPAELCSFRGYIRQSV
jgi:8-oxo-dGTP diphosphatase